MRSAQEQIDADYQKLEKIRDRRSEILKRLEELREIATVNKTARDEKNKAISEKKIARDQMHQEKAKVSDKIKELIEKKKTILSSVDYAENDLLAQLKEISWRYQTTTLSLDEDRKAVQKISELERRLVFFKKVREVDQEIDRQRTLFDQLRSKANAMHSEIIALANESKTCHETLIKCYDERGTLVTELEGINKEIITLKDEIARMKDELFAANAHFRVAKNLAMQHKAEALAEQAKLMMNKRTELAEKANEKLKNKERMTFEEFAAMLETKGIPT
jgi:uncharacterized coiled-coil DUF342 family protein